jgi:predicted nucleotidyltransferase
MISSDEIKLIASKIKEKFFVKTIILFGSYAYGKPENESDIDLCIITDENKRKLEIIREIRKLLMTTIKEPIDLLVYKVDEFNERSTIKSTLEYKIKNDGIYL